MRPAIEPLRIRLFRAGAAVAMIVLLAGGAWYAYAAFMSRPIQQVRFTGHVDRVPAAALEALADGIRRASLQGVRTESVREAARAVPWVREASVRRRFPDAIEIQLEAFDAVARWGEQQMVSSRGEIFPARTSARLPVFRGPEDSAMALVAAYPQISQALAPLASPVAELRLSPRGAWQVVLESGMVLELGRGDVQPRLARFAATWPQLAAKGIETKHVDLRHINGFAVKKS
jgi:cell division protein FtsQ